MINLGNNSMMVQESSELPDFENAEMLFLDIESNSFDPKTPAFFPYQGHRICGIAVTADDCERVYYIPIRHTEGDNIDLNAGLSWLKRHLSKVPIWVNHSITFDAHFCAVDGAVIHDDMTLIDTLTLSKLYYSDRMFYDLKSLCRDWCKLSMGEEKEIKAYLKSIKSKNYADVPADILGRYACMDVLGNRQLYDFLVSKMPESMSRVIDNEIRLTPVLWDMERTGMYVNDMELKVAKALSIQKQLKQTQELKDLTEFEMNPSSNQDCFEVLITQLGLPILEWNYDDNGMKRSAKFDKNTLEMYKIHPAVLVDEKLKRIVELVHELRLETHFSGLFLDPYIKFNVNGVVHPSFNQCVRTGRMSCRRPNAQQLNERAKKLVHAPDFDPFSSNGSITNGILACDYSQVEFRLIAHYINDPSLIQDYNEKEDVDFHQWVADVCGIDRDTAKRINFGTAYGAGKAKITTTLTASDALIKNVSEELDEEIEKGFICESLRAREFQRRVSNKAAMFFSTYHERMPGIKLTSRRAQSVAAQRGYVFNHYGRRRYLQSRFAYRAFNSIIQSCAADVMKDCVLNVAPRYNKWVRDAGINIFAIVHDDVSLYGPWEVLNDPDIQKRLRESLETTSIDFKIPIKMDMGISDRDWAEAAKSKCRLMKNGETKVFKDKEKEQIESALSDGWELRGGPIITLSK